MLAAALVIAAPPLPRACAGTAIRINNSNANNNNNNNEQFPDRPNP